jgi:hypothetical protein
MQCALSGRVRLLCLGALLSPGSGLASSEGIERLTSPHGPTIRQLAAGATVVVTAQVGSVEEVVQLRTGGTASRRHQYTLRVSTAHRGGVASGVVQLWGPTHTILPEFAVGDELLVLGVPLQMPWVYAPMPESQWEPGLEWDGFPPAGDVVVPYVHGAVLKLEEGVMVAYGVPLDCTATGGFSVGEASGSNQCLTTLLQAVTAVAEAEGGVELPGVSEQVARVDAGFVSAADLTVSPLALQQALRQVDSPPPYALYGQQRESLGDASPDAVQAFAAGANAHAAAVHEAGVAPAALELRKAMTVVRIEHVRAGRKVSEAFVEEELMLHALGRSAVVEPRRLLEVTERVRPLLIGPHLDTTDRIDDAFAEVFRQLDAIEQRW